MAMDTNSSPMKVVTGDGLAYYHEKVKLLVKNAQGVELTQAQYDQLSEEEKLNGTTYFIKDGDEGSISASSIIYKGKELGTVLDAVNANIESLKSDDGIIKSANADYAEIGMWSDQNPKSEDRVGYFVTVSKTESGITMTKANSTSDVRGVTVSTPAFAAGASSDKYGEDGKLLKKYSYVAFVGFVKVYDNGSCTIGKRCVCDDNGCATPSPNNMGYEVIDRFDSNSILILIEPSGDMLSRIKSDVDELGSGIDAVTPVRLTQEEYDALPDTKLTDDKIYLITDSGGSGSHGGMINSSEVDYDNEETGLKSTNIQDAISEINSTKGSVIEYDDEKSKLILKNGNTEISSTTIKSGSGGLSIDSRNPTNVKIEELDGQLKVSWIDPEDVIIDDVTFATWGGTILLYNKDHAPTNENDGTIVVDNTERNKYSQNGFIIDGVTNDIIYNLYFIPYTTLNKKKYSDDNRYLAIPSKLRLDTVTNVSVTTADKSITVNWTNPAKTKTKDSVTATWANTTIVVKEGSYPSSISDGTVYKSTTYSEGSHTFTVENGKDYYVTIFVVSDLGSMNYVQYENSIPMYAVLTIVTEEETLIGKTVTVTCGSNKLSDVINIGKRATFKCPWIGSTKVVSTDGTDEANGAINISSFTSFTLEISFYKLYGFRIKTSDSNPATRVEYLSGTENENFTSAKMNYSTGKFDYGDWEDVFFIKDLKPCMLKYDGTVDYELDPNNYAKKKDGSASDIANTSYEGNAMIGFPTIWTKYYEENDYLYAYVSDKQVDSSYNAYSHTNSKGDIIPYAYMPAYNGSLISNKLRSLSGQTCMQSQNATSEVTYAKANNLTGSDIWYTEVLADRLLVNTLLILIGKSTNTQEVFGNGNIYYQSSSSLIKTGTMNDKGLFFGSNSTSSNIGVKVFGIENYWANQWRRIAGWINANGTQKIKLTYGKQDGSTVEGYNMDGNGYITIASATPSGSSGGYITTMKATAGGLIPVTSTASATTYFCDGLWFNNSQVNYAYVGGGVGNSLLCGALCSDLVNAASASNWYIGASLSCKPS